MRTRSGRRRSRDRRVRGRRGGRPIRRALAAVDRALAQAAERAARPGVRRRLFRTLDRAQLSGREAALWTAFLGRTSEKKIKK